MIITICLNTLVAQNIALNKSYTLSAPPNYAYSAPPTDKTSLTDGIYSKGKLWTKPTTVGWLRRQVTVTIDLGEIKPVEAVTFNTLRNANVGISFPQNIYVFISNDNKEFEYVGDAADTPDNLPGAYEVKKFILREINTAVRYVALIVVPKGNFLFCDEIEVLKGKVNNLAKGSIAKDRLNQAVDSLKTVEYNRRNLGKAMEQLKVMSKNKSGINDKEFSEINTQLSNKNISENELRNIRSKAGQQHALNLKSKFNVPFILEKYNPWDSLSELHEPKENSNVLNYQILIPKNGAQYGSFVITNSDSSAQQFSFKASNFNNGIDSIELFHVPYVPSSNFTRVPDPLITINDAITINPGISEMFLFKTTGISSGTGKSNILIQSGSQTRSVTIEANAQNTVFTKAANNLSSNVWAYLNYPMLKDRQAEAAKDLEAHHINSIVVPPVILPKMQADVYTTFINYLKNFESIKNILLFMNYSSAGNRNGYKGGQFMSLEWRKSFILWYNNIVKLVHENGFPDAQIYLYPYDEVRGKNIEDFKSFATWAKGAVPGIKFYATLTKREAIDNILRLVDIAQIPGNLELFQQLPAHNSEIWIYSGGSPSRSLSPYGFYRLMAWKAFVNDITGIGFWNYADEGKDKQLNLITDPLLNPASSYSVIYNGPGKEIISSRRWEAFRLGIEDYSILKAYAKKNGADKAKALAQKVLSDPGNVNLADIVRDEMLKAL